MTHQTPFSNLTRNGALFGVAIILSACAGGDKEYPSFTIPTTGDDTGRVAMRFPAVDVPEPRDATPTAVALPAELDARLAAINNRATVAANAFSGGVEGTRALANAARPNSPESDSYSAALVRIADLASHHSTTQLALADLDQLAATAALSGSVAEESVMIDDLRSDLSRTVAQQAQLLADIAAQLNR